MKASRYIGLKLFSAIPLLLGVTFISFLLMVFFGPDKTYQLLGKNPTPVQIEEVRAQLGYDRPFMVRYADYLVQLATLDLGLSDSSGEPVRRIVMRSFPVSLALILPGFVIGNLLGVVVGMLAAWRRGQWLDRTVTGLSVAGMSLSFLVVIIALQVLLCTPYGLNLFPTRGWEVSGLPSYLSYVTVPSLSLIIIALGYNARFYRAVFIEELGREHIRAAQAFGATTTELLFRHALRNALVPIITRVVFSIPLIVISGSLLIESYFGIPGIGKVTFDAVTSGDQPVLKAVVGLTAVLFVAAQVIVDIGYRLVDPRVAGR